MAEQAERWEIFTDEQGQFRFRFVAGNGEIVCQSEGYIDKAACNDGIDAIELAVISRAVADKLLPLARVNRVEVKL